MPKKALIHIQNTAPGPPEAIAVATPAKFPVPTWAAIAVARAWNEDIPPSLSSVFSFLLEDVFKSSYLRKSEYCGI